MKKLLIPFVIVLLFACNGRQISKAKPNTDTVITESSPQPTPVKDSIPAKRLNNKTLFDIEGRYSLEQSESSCKLDLTLYREKGQLRYKLVTNTRNLTGAAAIELNEKKDDYYLAPNNLEWSENEGALNVEGEPIEADIKLPTDVQAVLYKDEITIQNAGKAMNNCVEVGECDLKYIILKRKASGSRSMP